MWRSVFKRIFDILFSFLGIAALWWLILIAWIVASVDTRANGLFCQRRVGRHGKTFLIYKIRTMHVDKSDGRSTITVAGMNGISRSGRWLRKYKIDELPQLFNVLLGQMSFVGPRPDVPGYADRLVGDERLILELRPGITGPASLKYRDEEVILSRVSDAKKYNDEVIWPDKVRINAEYYRGHSLFKDVMYIWKTVRG